MSVVALHNEFVPYVPQVQNSNSKKAFYACDRLTLKSKVELKLNDFFLSFSEMF